MEMAILVKDVFNALPEGVEKYLIGPAPLMTSLDMNGISITLMPLNDEKIRKYMFDGCGAHSAWPYVSDVPCSLTSQANYPKDPLSSQDV